MFKLHSKFHIFYPVNDTLLRKRIQFKIYIKKIVCVEEITSNIKIKESETLFVYDMLIRNDVIIKKKFLALHNKYYKSSYTKDNIKNITKLQSNITEL